MTKKVVTPEPKAHAKFSASGASRWLACPGSIALSLNAPPEPESKYAAEGTQAHACLEAMLKAYIDGSPEGDPIIQTRDQLLVQNPKDMVRYASDACCEIVIRAARTGGDILCESKVELGHIHGELGGTLDAAIVNVFGRLTVIDFKYGAGIAVDPRDNPQLIIYAIGIAAKYDYNFEDVALVIIQPRAEHPDGPIREHVMTIEELQEWERVFATGTKAAEKKDAELKAGDHCRFCNAKPICPEVGTRALKNAQAAFNAADNSLTLVPPASIQIPHLGNILNAAQKLKIWIAAVEEHAQHVLEEGETVPGWKLVAKRAQRKWSDAELVESEGKKLFGHQILETSLKSPAQFEKISSEAKRFVDTFTTSESSGNTLAPEQDRRPAVGPSAAAVFGELPPAKNILPLELAHARVRKTAKAAANRKTEKRK